MLKHDAPNAQYNYPIRQTDVRGEAPTRILKPFIGPIHIGSRHTTETDDTKGIQQVVSPAVQNTSDESKTVCANYCCKCSYCKYMLQILLDNTTERLKKMLKINDDINGKVPVASTSQSHPSGQSISVDEMFAVSLLSFKNLCNYLIVLL